MKSAFVVVSLLFFTFVAKADQMIAEKPDLPKYKALSFSVVITRVLKKGSLATVLHTTINTKGGGRPEGLPDTYKGKLIYVMGLYPHEAGNVYTNIFVHRGSVSAVDGTPLPDPLEKWIVVSEK